ncbi:MAG: CHASE3 domain-containing protein [Lutibacter sp.]|nr:CHASE3 domain-containing protein [Lutibacter sp.]
MTRKLFSESALILRIIFIISVFIILLTGGFSYKNISNLKNSTKLVVSTYEVNIALKEVISYLKDAESSYRNYMFTKDTLYLNQYLNAREKVTISFAQLKEITSTDTVQKENLITLNKLIASLFNNLTETIGYVDNNQTYGDEFKSKLFEENIIMYSISRKVNDMIEFEKRQLEERQKQHQSNLQFTPLTLYFILIITLLLIIISYNKISNNFNNIKLINNQLLIFKEAAIQLEIIGKHGNWVWDVETNEFTFSDNLYRVLGEEPQSFEPTVDNFMKFVHPGDQENLTKKIKQMMQDKNLPFIYYRIVQKDGSTKHIKGYGKLLTNNDGESRLIGNITDISDEIESFLEIEKRNVELERNNEELSAFNYIASHDLQEPLRKIQTFISRLEEKEAEKFSSSGYQYLEGIKTAAARMRLLIDDLLEYSRINKSDKEFVMADLNEILEKAKQDVAEIISEKKAIITSDILPSVTGIPFQMQQLFLNLLSNSLKYSKKDKTPIINIEYTKVKRKEDPNLINTTKSDYHKITFSDNGIGFNQEYAEQIFELFNRIHSKQDYSGTGVGLSICKKIMENHHGFIFAKGKPNVGAIFTLYLPIK